LREIKDRGTSPRGPYLNAKEAPQGWKGSRQKESKGIGMIRLRRETGEGFDSTAIRGRQGKGRGWPTYHDLGTMG